MTRWLTALVLFGCTSNATPKDGETGGGGLGDDTGEHHSGWGILADKVGDGVLLSAWSDGDDVLFVGGDMGGGPGVMARYTGTSLCTESDVTDRALWWIHGVQPGHWVAVGEAGRVLRSVDGVRERMDIETDATLFGVWVTEDEMIAVGGDPALNIGEVWRHDGTTWTAIATDLPGSVFKVWENWAVGVDVLYQIEGDALISYPAMGRLLTARGRNANDIWAVGGLTSSLVVHWDGTQWREADTSGIGQPLNGIWTDSGEDVWIAGNFGTTMFWDGTAWQGPEWPTTSEHFHAVWKHGDEVLWAGGNLFSTSDNYGTIARYGDTPKTLEVTPCE